jgi:hypothetical protein
VSLLYRLSKRIFAGRHSYVVDVIVHQGVSPYRNPVALTGIPD